MNKWNFATKNIGIDLGTTKILVTVTGKGIVLDEPLIVAVNKFTKEVLSIGDKAETIYNNDPQNVDLVKPMKDGVIADYQTISAILKSKKKIVLFQHYFYLEYRVHFYSRRLYLSW